MTEIIYVDGRIKVRHDNEILDYEAFSNHIKENGHVGEIVGVYVPSSVYDECCRMAADISKIFEKKAKEVRRVRVK